MKKLILILTFVFALTLCFVACDELGDNSDEGQSQNVLLNGAPYTEEPTTEESTTEESMTEDSSGHFKDDLIAALVNYLQNVNTLYYLGDTSYEAKINDIKRGEQPLLVRFNSERYYFVCGYYNATHEYPENKSSGFCCATEYTWVKFKKATDIQEYYDDKKLIVAFQINNSAFVKNISPKSAYTPNVEHFQMYETLFVNGKNVNDCVEFGETFIYLTPTNKLYVYCSVFSHDYKMNNLPCVELNGGYYIPIRTQTSYPDGEVVDVDIKRQLGDYYDVLIGVMEKRKYSENTEGGYTLYYGLFDLEKFMDAIFK